MRFNVGILRTPASQEADLKHTVRGCSNVDEAIVAFMKSEDLYYAYAAYAYPVSKRYSGPTPKDWRNDVKCSVTGQISMNVGMPSKMIDINCNA